MFELWIVILGLASTFVAWWSRVHFYMGLDRGDGEKMYKFYLWWFIAFFFSAILVGALVQDLLAR